jgi:hypothetical protein
MSESPEDKTFKKLQKANFEDIPEPLFKIKGEELAEYLKPYGWTSEEYLGYSIRKIQDNMVNVFDSLMKQARKTNERNS